jgi:putative phosphoesterase
MIKAGILSDTHACWDERYLQHFEGCDEIWHAGDIGNIEVANRLREFRPLRAVFGNIDGQDVRQMFPEINRFTVAGADVMIKHIGGRQGAYDHSVAGILRVAPPQLFVSGHSHILRVAFDRSLNMLHINPGAAGTYGFHKVRTLIRLIIDNGAFRDLEVVELG